MEYASHLAGERWSDHPPCTHPAVASLARLVNDWTTDAHRSRLSPLIPSVIGLVGDDERVDLAVAVAAASSALPVASEGRQRALAVGLIRCSSRSSDIDADDAAGVRATARAALDQAPLAEKWALQQLDIIRPRPPKSFAPLYDAIVNVALAGIGEACIPDADERLERLLRTVIADCVMLLAAAEQSQAREVELSRS
ncbi:MAG: hypothetical protein JWL94_249 [Microbacteriaceae bacterium]|jgi:hypothetical protein|nr:hypothetical protein [Microbacteriaceae bacterium]